MFLSLPDLLLTLQWWGYIFVIGLISFPLVSRLFSSFTDKGYAFAKIIGMVVLSYLVFILGVTHVAPFTQLTVIGTAICLAAVITILLIKFPQKLLFSFSTFFLIALEEVLFLGGLLFWAHVRAYQPDIFGLEKYMDFGFVNSILRSTYFPPRDMWYTPYPINYYYFGHLVTAVITRLTGIPSLISFNLMLATLFAFTYTLSFSIAGNLWSAFLSVKTKKKNLLLAFIPAGILGGFLVTMSGNLHTIYTFFKAYPNDSPVPFWQLPFSVQTFPNNYWYPNATRFIYHTIHEFPSYSYIVSDLHGHVLDIPMVLTTVAILFSIISKSQVLRIKQTSNIKSQKLKQNNLVLGAWHLFGDWKLEIGNCMLIGFLLAIMYMTNAWDGMIYFLLTAVVLFWKNKQQKKNYLLSTIYQLITIFLVYLLFSLPFSLFFDPGALVGGIGLVCPPQFLINVGKLGPFVFEANHCTYSPLWQLGILYGFFIFWLVSFLFILRKERKQVTTADIFAAALSGISLFLIILPEFFYLRDIYTTYFRANTMFKLVYQAFMLFSLATSYMILRFVYILSSSRLSIVRKVLLLPYLSVGVLFLTLVVIYPYFGIMSYYGNLNTYQGLNGTAYLAKSYPTDALAITWLNTHVTGQPVVLEAQGDSYTEYARISANTGLPTVLGWPVHEWLWRGTYNIVPPRSIDIQTMYMTSSPQTFLALARKYAIQYVFVGQLERQKYSTFNEQKFLQVGKVVFHAGITTIYRISL